MALTTRSIAVEGGPSLPVLVLDAPAAGPCAVITANLHGDELTGLAACQRLAATLGPDLERGRVVLFPSLNPQGLAERVRTVPSDGGDLNRCFPGKRRGRGSERLAAAIWRSIAELRAEVVVDLHADSARSVPYVLLDRPVRLSGRAGRAMTSRLEALGQATGLFVIHEYPPEIYTRYSLDRSLSGALVNRAQVAAITIEAGPRRGIEPDAVGVVVEAVRGVLGTLEITGHAPRPHPARREGRYRRVTAPRTPIEGWWDAEVAPGSTVARGDRLGVVRRIDGSAAEVLKAGEEGVVLSWVDSGWLAAGGAVGTMAVEEGR